MDKKKNTIVVAAFPCTGKTYLKDHCKDYDILDLDSSEFKWIKYSHIDARIPNPEFPGNYIKKIKENLGKVDFILVSTHKEVIEMLNREDIIYSYVGPNNKLLDEYIIRMRNRGDSEEFILYIKEIWYYNSSREVAMKNGYIELESGEYLDIEKMKHYMPYNFS